LPRIPSDNIFVPIQADNIPPQVPIGVQHPVPRKGIEDDEYRTLHTNKFYANAFLGEQNQPVWTHPYAIWWGKGGRDGGFPSWGMNVGHNEESDLVYGSAEPATVITVHRIRMRGGQLIRSRVTSIHGDNASFSGPENSMAVHSWPLTRISHSQSTST
jgi:endoglucanase Acf2